MRGCVMPSLWSLHASYIQPWTHRVWLLIKYLNAIDACSVRAQKYGGKRTNEMTFRYILLSRNGYGQEQKHALSNMRCKWHSHCYMLCSCAIPSILGEQSLIVGNEKRFPLKFTFCWTEWSGWQQFLHCSRNNRIPHRQWFGTHNNCVTYSPPNTIHPPQHTNPYHIQWMEYNEMLEYRQP